MSSTLRRLYRLRPKSIARQQPSEGGQQPLRAAYYRGGTSRALIFHPQDLPSNRAKWPAIFRQLMGSGDRYGRQLDGMGAGISSLSKICLVEASGEATLNRKHGRHIDEIQRSIGDTTRADVDYTFVGLGIENDEVDVAGNCGNMSSAIGPYAYNARLLPPHLYAIKYGDVTVKIRNTNTNKFIDSTFSVVAGQAAVTGDYTIDGVSGSGSKVRLDFRNPYGSKTGKVLPTGNKIDVIQGYRVSCVDGPNPAVFIRADEVGVDGTILPNDFNKLPEKLELLETIRKSAAVAMGLADTEDQVPRTIPKIGLVSSSATHPVLSGTNLKTAEVDLVVRFISDTQPHRAIPLTAALTTAIAARIPGTVVEQLLAPDPVMQDAITIGHASGRLQVNATMDPKNKLIPLSATVYRTAKRLFEGNMFWTDTSGTLRDITHDPMSTHSLGMAFVMESRGQNMSDPLQSDVQEKDKDAGDRVLSSQNSDKPTLDVATKSTAPRTSPFTQSMELSHRITNALRELEELEKLVMQPSDGHSSLEDPQSAHSSMGVTSSPQGNVDRGRQTSPQQPASMHPSPPQIDLEHPSILKALQQTEAELADRPLKSSTKRMKLHRARKKAEALLAQETSSTTASPSTLPPSPLRQPSSPSKHDSPSLVEHLSTVIERMTALKDVLAQPNDNTTSAATADPASSPEKGTIWNKWAKHMRTRGRFHQRWLDKAAQAEARRLKKLNSMHWKLGPKGNVILPKAYLMERARVRQRQMERRREM